MSLKINCIKIVCNKKPGINSKILLSGLKIMCIV